MGHWNETKIKWISRCLAGKATWKYVGFNRYDGGRTTAKSLKKEDIQTKDLIIGYNSDLDIFIVWNSLVHRENVAGVVTPMSLSAGHKTLFALRHEINGIYPIYHRPNSFNKKYEKLLVIEPYFMPEFCEAPFSYLLPDPSDDGYQKDTVYAEPKNPTAKVWDYGDMSNPYVIAYRERYNCTRAKRDATFRKRVFSSYAKPHCIICGIELENVLEAAHIVEVQYDNDDSTENGICLCRNHHKMYDDGSLEIDFCSNTFYFTTSEAAQTMSKEIDERSNLI